MTNTTSSFVSASNTAMDTTFTTYFTFNHLKKTIVGSEFNFKMSGNPTKPQYEALMTAKKMQPTYSLELIVSKKKVEKKQTYKGLSMELMADYIRIAGTEQSKAEFKHMVEGKTAYPTIKSWFLDEFKHFNVNQAKAQIASLRKVSNDYMDDALRRTEEAIALSLEDVRDTRSKFKALIEAQEKRAAVQDVEV